VSRPATSASATYERIYAVVKRIPRGRVATYGQVAALAGLAGHARQVGYALFALPASGGTVPWHRVINGQGRVSERSEPGHDLIQRLLLEREGVRFDGTGRVALGRYRWSPRGRMFPRRASGTKGRMG